jgi:peptide deformylase
VQQGVEGCLSLKDSSGNIRRFLVDRHGSISVNGLELVVEESGKLVFRSFQKIFSGFEAILYAHEIDHQNGILISQIGEEVSFW